MGGGDPFGFGGGLSDLFEAFFGQGGMFGGGGAGLAAGWDKWDSVIMEQLAPVGAAIIERLDLRR